MASAQLCASGIALGTATDGGREGDTQHEDALLAPWGFLQRKKCVGFSISLQYEAVP